ncbi:MAG: hypothetical protein KY445_03675 [Armatimonadetes bacterium]|nr:hypothetical protein [Armatimonadota bacterium]
MNILESQTVAAQFWTMLQQSGVDLQRPNVRQVWEVWKDFAKLPVECSAERCVEGFLLECGCYNFSNGAFVLHFSRNFHIGNGGAAWTEMLDCDFTFKANDEIRNLKIYIEKVPADYPDTSQAFAVFVEEVEARTELWQVIDKFEPVETFIGCHGV